MQEIKVRKPKYPFNADRWIEALKKYDNRWYLYYAKLPKNGDIIKLTWLPDYNGKSPNAYIGFEGVVCGMDIVNYKFSIKSKGAALHNIDADKFNYIKVAA